MMVHLSGATYVNFDNVESINVSQGSSTVVVTLNSGDQKHFQFDTNAKAKEKAMAMANHINEQISTPPDPEPAL